MGLWHCTVAGTAYGPVTVEVLRQWLAEGRVKPADLVWTEGMAGWMPASSVPELSGGAPGPAPLPPGAAPGAPGGMPQSFAPTTPGMAYAPTPMRYVKPHRGTTILVLSILGWVLCVVLGIVAWVMASNDLREMDGGLMDPSGRDMTKAGKIIAMIQVILLIVGIAIGLLSLVAGGFSHGRRF